jgi:hypothetical protein
MDPASVVPDSIEPITAYRCWTYGMGSRYGRLDPIGVPGGGFGPSGPWHGAARAWVTASCGLPGSPHRVPDEGCSCGFYSLKELSAAIELASPIHHRWLEDPGVSRPVVVGEIHLAGKVIEHDTGYRAERARIRGFIPFEGSEAAIMRLAARLGVERIAPSVVPTSWIDMFAMFLPGAP